MDLTIEFRNDFRASARLLRLLVCSTTTSNKQSKILVPTLSQPVQSTLHRPNNVLGFSPPSPPPTHKVMLLPLKKKKFCSPPLAQHKGHTVIPDYAVSMSSSCLCHGKSVFQALLHSFIFCCLIAGGLIIFSAVSRVSSFEVDNDTNDLVG